MNSFDLLLFVGSLFLLYLIYTSYSFQVLIRRIKFKKYFLKEFRSTVKGIYHSSGYFAISHPFITNEEFKSFSNRYKLSFSKCYNVITFKTNDANWELFFHLVKEGSIYSEILTIRSFPKKLRIKSEGNIEKNYSRLNIFTNNRYLTGVLENRVNDDLLKWLIRNNGDILLILHNNLHFKAFLKSKTLTVERALDMIKAMNGLKNNIFKEDVIEY